MEANRLVSGTRVKVQTAVGGTGKSYHMNKIRNEGCHILVGTPGRLNDILSDSRYGVQAPNLDAFVLDEADRMLDVGFAPEIQNIIRLLPAKREKDHQTLMFSATVPKEVLGMVREIMKPDYRFVQTVQPGEQQTHERVPQKIINVNGLENSLPSLLELMRREQARTDEGRPFKALVFFNTAAEASLAAAIFQQIPDFANRKASIIEMHSRLTQSMRTRSTAAFRRDPASIMFSSDVAARGMDFPDVSHVIQMGLPKEADTYVHRLGRTARGNKQGEGWLMVTPVERSETLHRLREMPLVGDTTLECSKVDMTQDSQLPADVAKCLTEIIEAARKVPEDLKYRAYRGSLGFFSFIGRKKQVVEMLNRRAIYGWGMPKPPGVSRSLAVKLGIADVPGIVFEAHRFEGGDDRAFSRDSRPFPPRPSDRRSSFQDDRPSHNSRSSFGSERPRSSYGSDRPRSNSGSDRRFGSDGPRSNDRPRGGFDRSSRLGGGGRDSFDKLASGPRGNRRGNP